MCTTPHSTVLYCSLLIKVFILNHVFVSFTDKNIIFYGVISLDFWTQTCQNGHIDSCDSADTRHLWQISEFYAILTTFVWAGNGPDKMAEPHGSKCAKTLLILSYMKECLFQAQTISPCSTWYMLHLMLLLLLCVKPIPHENSWEICFSDGFRQTLPMWQTGQFSTFYTSSFQS